MSASKLLIGPLASIHAFYTHLGEMVVSAVERHGAGIKGMDQLSTVTTRTQLQRIRIRSQSLRVVLSPPLLRFHKHTKKREYAHAHTQDVKTLNFCILEYHLCYQGRGHLFD